MWCPALWRRDRSSDSLRSYPERHKCGIVSADGLGCVRGGGRMAKGDAPTIWRVDDALWAELRPLLVVEKPRKKPGRPRRDDRAIFDGLIWIGRSGGQWAALPREFGPKSTVH